MFKVVNNHDNQFSIWPKNKVTPNGWSEVGFEGAREDCLEYIKSTWVDGTQ